MTRWIYNITTLFSCALCFYTPLEARISNVPPPASQESSISSSSISSSSESSSSISEKASQKPRAPAPFFHGPDRPKASFIKPARNKKLKNSDKRGRRGKPGKPGKQGKKGKKGSKGERGEKGEKGDPGSMEAFISARVIQDNETLIQPGETVKLFQVVSSEEILYNPESGNFISNAGPGHYEIVYGANWVGTGALVLRVDGKELPHHFEANTPPAWAYETMIVSSQEQNPTFSLASTNLSHTPMSLATNGGTSKAFITIKKIK